MPSAAAPMGSTTDATTRSPDSSGGAEEEALEADAEVELGVPSRRAMEKGHCSSWWR